MPAFRLAIHLPNQSRTGDLSGQILRALSGIRQTSVSVSRYRTTVSWREEAPTAQKAREQARHRLSAIQDPPLYPTAVEAA